MTLASQILTDVSEVFLNTDDFAEPVYRLEGGDVGSQTTIAAAVVRLKDPEIVESKGRGTIIKADVLLPEAQIILFGDALLIGGLRYEVVHVSDPQHGMKTASVTRYSGQTVGVKTAEGI